MSCVALTLEELIVLWFQFIVSILSIAFGDYFVKTNLVCRIACALAIGVIAIGNSVLLLVWVAIISCMRFFLF